MKTNWEYTVLKLETDYAFFGGTDLDTGKLEEQLNALGSEAWELVSVMDVNMLKGGSKFVVATLKRPK